MIWLTFLTTMIMLMMKMGRDAGLTVAERKQPLFVHVETTTESHRDTWHGDSAVSN
jgi:hypothetical protein